MIENPEAPGRGPARRGERYLWERDGDLPIVGKWVGYKKGKRKGLDVLIVQLPAGGQIDIHYEELVKAWQVDPCPKCETGWLRRLTNTSSRWDCHHCGHREERAEFTFDLSKSALQRRAKYAERDAQAAHLQDQGPQPPALS